MYVTIAAPLFMCRPIPNRMHVKYITIKNDFHAVLRSTTRLFLLSLVVKSVADPNLTLSSLINQAPWLSQLSNIRHHQSRDLLP